MSNLEFKKKLVKIFIHGFLHLFGYNHSKLNDYKKMYKEEYVKCRIYKLQKKSEEDSKKEDELIIKEREKLIEQQSVMAPEAFEVKVADFEKKVQTYQIERQEKLRKLDQMVQAARANILDEVKPIINDYANELGITVILEKNAVVMSADDMDMTDQVIEILNKSLPKIKVELEK